MNAAAQHEGLRAIDRMVRAEADALIAESTHEDCVLVRRALRVRVSVCPFWSFGEEKMGIAMAVKNSMTHFAVLEKRRRRAS